MIAKENPEEGSRKLVSQEVYTEHINKAQRPEKKSNNGKQFSAMAGIKGIFICVLLVKLRGPFSLNFSDIKTFLALCVLVFQEKKNAASFRKLVAQHC